MKAATRHRRLRLRLALLAAVAVVSAAAALTLGGTDALFSLELDTVDARYSLRGDRPPPRDIAIVAIDSRTLSELGASTAPLSRSTHARVIDRLRRERPKLIAYDLQFVDEKAPREDRALLRAISQARPVVLATQAVDGPPQRVPAGERDPGRVGGVLGSVEVLNDDDGVTRQLPYFREPPQAFAVVAAEQVLGRPVAADKFRDDAAWIDFRGPAGTFTHHSFSRVLRGQVPRGTFRDKIVLVGETAPVIGDNFLTPMSADRMPGVEVHANSLATILDDLPLRDVSSAADVLLTLLLSLVAPLVAIRLSAAYTIACAVLAGLVYAIATQLAFNGGAILPVLHPYAGLVIGTTGAVAIDLLLETRERRRLHQTFARFVPEQVVTDVMARTDDDLRLGGETLEATVLFCDLRGFTSFAERHTAATVIETLNRYLTEMTDAIFAHGGTTVAYMGDGVMAVFGAPIEQPDNARRAVAAAREMLDERLPAFNEWLRDKGFGEAFRIGIGLCSGPVMSGNVGSRRRLEYTAVGDTTNVAARLQEQTKQLGTQLAIADSTRVRLGDAAPGLVDLGEHAIPGRTGKIRVWGTSAPSESTRPPDVDVSPRS